VKAADKQWKLPPELRDHAYTALSDGLDRTALAHRNHRLMLELGFPVSTIIEQLGKVIAVCPVCGAEKANPDRMTCGRRCAGHLRRSRRSRPIETRADHRTPAEDLCQQQGVRRRARRPQDPAGASVNVTSPTWRAVTRKIRRQGPGNCYEAAYELYRQRDRLGLTDAKIVVSGTVIGQGPLAGVRFAHYWVEAGEPDERLAFDFSNGSGAIMARRLCVSSTLDLHEPAGDEEGGDAGRVRLDRPPSGSHERSAIRDAGGGVRDR
jgi:hypothetical protein